MVAQWRGFPVVKVRFLCEQYPEIAKNVGGKMKYIENIVIGNPILPPCVMLASDVHDWINNEIEKTYYTNERFLPKILVELGIYPSISEIRRNKPNLMVSLDKLDFLDNLKVSKKRRLWILVGE